MVFTFWLGPDSRRENIFIHNIYYPGTKALNAIQFSQCYISLMANLLNLHPT